MAALLYVFFLYACIIPYSVQGNGITPPGLSFHPTPPMQGGYENTLIWYHARDNKNITFWTKKIDDFLGVYKNPSLLPQGGHNLVNCNYDHPPPAGQVCSVDMRGFGPCIKENHYGYHRRSPCVFLSLDNKLGWTPRFYNDTNTLPAQMSQFLKHHIEIVTRDDPKLFNTVWMTCEGENPADAENIGAIQYYPRPGFPGYYFPFMNTEGYLSPLVAIHFERPLYGIVIGVECKAWAQNINNGQMEKQGSVCFDLLID